MNKIKINVKNLESKLINRSQLYKKETNYKDFGQVLDKVKKEQGDIVFSKHALSRIENRNVKITNFELEKLKYAIDKADNKGVNEALIIVGDKAFIASIKNKTIITTLSKDNIKDNVFTNIDGAVIV